MSESDKVWVTGLNGPPTDPGVDRARAPAPSPDKPRRRRFDPLMLLAVVVGVVVGVSVYAIWLQPPARVEPIRYEVVSGDTLWRIASVHGVSVAALKDWNQLASDTIDVGQILLIYPPEADGEVEARSATGRGGTIRGGNIQARPIPQDPGGLHMPQAKPCLTLDESELGELDMVASKGLSYAQTKAAMDAFLPTLGRCFGDEAVDGSVTYELTVGCSGRVAEVRVINSSGLPDAILGCARDTLRYAEFPAHDMPDGFTFAYPMTFQFGQ